MNDHSRSALILGANGQVGSECLRLLLEEDRYYKIVVLVRRHLSVKNAKLEQHVIDFNKIQQYASIIVADDFYSCLGTGSKHPENFRKVDYDYPLEVARIALKNGASRALVVSALGADPASSNLYFKVKGEIENALGSLGFQSVSVFRISMMYGNKDDKRRMQVISKRLTKLFSFLLYGPIKKYGAIAASDVARAMIQTSLKDLSGNSIYYSDAIKKIADTYHPLLTMEPKKYIQS